MSSLRRIFTAVSLTVLVSGLPLMASPGGIITPMAGTVAVNGQPVTAGTAIVSGDQVVTGAHGTARLVLAGASLLAAAHTRVRMGTAAGVLQVRLSRGLLEVAGHLPVVVAAHTVVPADSHARFNVYYDQAGEAYVTAVAGAVTVTSVRGVVPVAAGTTVKFQQQALPAPVALKTGISPAVVAGMVVAAAAATGAAVYFVERNKNTTVSPSSL